MLLNVANWVVFYNTAAFEKAGIAAPPTTWDELMADCRKAQGGRLRPVQRPDLGRLDAVHLVLPTRARHRSRRLRRPDRRHASPMTARPCRTPSRSGARCTPRATSPIRASRTTRSSSSTGTAAMFLIGDWHSGSFAEAGMEPGDDFKTFLMPSLSTGRAAVGDRRSLADRRLQGGARSKTTSRST